MLGTVFPLCWCIGLACSNPGAFKLLGRARSWWEHGSLQEVSCQWVLPRTTATTVSVPTESQSHTLTSPGAPLRPACRSHPVSYEVSAFSLRCSAYETLCVPSKRGKLLLPSVLWSSYDQALLAFKAILWRRILSVLDPQTVELRWGSELSLLWKNLCGISGVCKLPA